MERIINGENIEFAKSVKSHLTGDECLYVGQASDGSVKLFESDSPAAVITTSPQKIHSFVEAVARGEFNFLR